MTSHKAQGFLFSVSLVCYHQLRLFENELDRLLQTVLLKHKGPCNLVHLFHKLLCLVPPGRTNGLVKAYSLSFLVPVTCMIFKKKQLDLKRSQTFEVYIEYDTSFTPKKTHYNGATEPFDPQ